MKRVLVGAALVALCGLGVMAQQAEQAPVRLDGTIKEPRKTHHVNPVYPSIAQVAGVQGVVILEATIATSGNVTDVRVLRGIPLLDASAMTAVSQWRYEPTLLNGVPVPVIMTVNVNFILERATPSPPAGPGSVAAPSALIEVERYPLDAELIGIGQQRPILLQVINTLAHEIGHALGLDLHSSADHDLMSDDGNFDMTADQGRDPRSFVTAADRNTLLHAYCK